MGVSYFHRSCDRLRCTECDFVVVSFAGYSWSTNVDYLFLRNNSPDFEKLKAKLLSRTGLTVVVIHIKDCISKYFMVKYLKNRLFL